ncbi:unnamed protein product, partial [Polarella glacialis]
MFCAEAVRDTIEIIDGPSVITEDGIHASTTRLSLKTQLERFGAIDICHKIGDPKEDTPWVRFRDPSAAQQAIDSIEKGDVLIDGVAIKAQWRGRKKEPPGGMKGRQGSSRDLFLETRNKERGGGGRGRSRSRSRRRSNSRGPQRRGQPAERRSPERRGGGGRSPERRDRSPERRDRSPDRRQGRDVRDRRSDSQ